MYIYAATSQLGTTTPPLPAVEKRALPVSFGFDGGGRNLEQTVWTKVTDDLIVNAARTSYLVAVFAVQEVVQREEREIRPRRPGVERLVFLFGLFWLGGGCRWSGLLGGGLGWEGRYCDGLVARAGDVDAGKAVGGLAGRQRGTPGLGVGRLGHQTLWRFEVECRVTQS